MPDATLSQALREAYAAAPSNVIIYHTLEINHAAFTAPIRVVRDTADLTATLEATAPHDPGAAVTFVGFRFDLVPPDSGPTAVPQCVIEIDNVDRSILSQIEAAMTTTSLVTVIYRQFISTDLSVPQNNPPLTLTIMSITANVFRIRATAGFGDLSNKRFPGVDYTAEVFPGLVP